MQFSVKTLLSSWLNGSWGVFHASLASCASFLNSPSRLSKFAGESNSTIEPLSRTKTLQSEQSSSLMITLVLQSTKFDELLLSYLITLSYNIAITRKPNHRWTCLGNLPDITGYLSNKTTSYKQPWRTNCQRMVYWPFIRSVSNRTCRKLASHFKLDTIIGI